MGRAERKKKKKRMIDYERCMTEMTKGWKRTLLCGLGARRRDNRALDSAHLPQRVQGLEHSRQHECASAGWGGVGGKAEVGGERRNGEAYRR